MPDQRKLRVFLCHASQDKPIVRELYHRLAAEAWIDPWLEEEKLLPGQDWDLEIEKAVESADVVIVCVSSRSVTKEGYVQKEIRKVLDIALEKPEETIFIIPLRIEECDLPRRLRTWQYVDYFPIAQQDRAYQRLSQSLRLRLGQISSTEVEDRHVPLDTSVRSEAVEEKKTFLHSESFQTAEPFVKTEEVPNTHLGGSILLIVFFALVAVDIFSGSNNIIELLLAASAILAGGVLLLKRQIPAIKFFKAPLIVALLIFGLDYRLTGIVPAALYIAGLAAAVAGGMLARNVQVSWKRAVYSSISLAAFLFLVGMYQFATDIGYMPLVGTIDTLRLVVGVITSVLLWMEV